MCQRNSCVAISFIYHVSSPVGFWLFRSPITINLESRLTFMRVNEATIVSQHLLLVPAGCAATVVELNCVYKNTANNIHMTCISSVKYEYNPIKSLREKTNQIKIAHSNQNGEGVLSLGYLDKKAITADMSHLNIEDLYSKRKHCQKLQISKTPLGKQGSLNTNAVYKSYISSSYTQMLRWHMGDV